MADEVDGGQKASYTQVSTRVMWCVVHGRCGYWGATEQITYKGDVACGRWQMWFLGVRRGGTGQVTYKGWMMDGRWQMWSLKTTEQETMRQEDISNIWQMHIAEAVCVQGRATLG